uniref:Uncharacterized protein n=1 Tax=Candidatus Methanogaster sp. ANME-2c ERB4 TaxID=2759911 RepID=A0A7G9YKY2_9EURY|nr:hypothetical protein LENKHJGJ_00037 [Methanosarcinales archaeon ANME-2c ERB4]
MSPNILVCGFLGGFLVSIIPYVDELKSIQPEEDVEHSNESVNVWKDARKTFNLNDLSHCVVCGLFGVVVVWLIEPQVPLYAFYLGMAAYPTISKFFGALYTLNKRT